MVAAMKGLALLALLALAVDDPRFAAGIEAYNEFDFERAALELQSLAIDAERFEPEARAEIFVWLGLAQAGLGDFDEAERRFTDAVALIPTMTLPVEVSPKVAKLFEEVKARRPAAPAEPEPGPAGQELTVPLIVGGAGAALVVTGAVLTGTAIATASAADDPDAFQTDAKAALDAANLQIGVAYGAYLVGAALVGTGAFLYLQE